MPDINPAQEANAEKSWFDLLNVPHLNPRNIIKGGVGEPDYLTKN
jgi:hypothetical protein